MPRRSYNGNEVDRGFSKLEELYNRNPGNGLNLRSGKEKFGWYYVEGKRVFQVSSKKGPRSVGAGRAHQLAKYLRLNDNDFAALCDCPMTGPEYHSRIVDRIAKGTL